MRLLLIEDDPEAATLLCRSLRESGQVQHAAEGCEGLARATEGGYDVIITDRMLPQLDGLAIVQSLRQQGNRTPILVLSALGTVEDRVHGLKAGGDDYLAKPFALRRAARQSGSARTTPCAGTPSATTARVDLELDLLSRKVTRGGQAIDLTAREFNLLEFLVRRAGQVVTRTMLLEGVWDLQFDPQTNLVEVHISRLRRALDRDFGKPLNHTERGAGYVVREPV